MNSELLWTPSTDRQNKSELKRYINFINSHYSVELTNYFSVHQWSVNNSTKFWASLLDFFNIEYKGNKDIHGEMSFLTYPFFLDVKLNFAKVLLCKRSDEEVTLEFFHESGLEKKISYAHLISEVADLQNEIRPFIKKGDVVGAYMPNTEHTVISMLACSSLGGVFTSTSCDFGDVAVIERFSQSRPKVLVAALEYEYAGKRFDQRDKIHKIVKSIDSIKKVIVVDFLSTGIDERPYTLWHKMKCAKSKQIEFCDVRFNDPLYIMYSSGTTGRPKCIVHSVGGSLLQHHKELSLHCDLKQKEKIFYFTTCGWMMWNWLVSSLALKATVVLYEGSPTYPNIDSFMDQIEKREINIFGTGPKFLRALEASLAIRKFTHLKTLLSTGAPLLADQFDFVYRYFPSDIHLASISGGTDILGCFMLGNPLQSVKKGQIQGPGLGMDIDCFDSNGKSLRSCEGELVCKKPFVSMPIGFLNDEDGKKIRSAYFEKYPGNWHHGDFITYFDDGSVIVHGRSDATLNPGGVRIGTAEIYAQTEKIFAIDDSLCVGRDHHGDVEVVLFVKLKDKYVLTEQIKDEIKLTIKKNTSARHVPRHIFSVEKIPYTRSGKKMELAVTRILSGKKLDNLEAMMDPSAINEYKQVKF